MSENPFQLPETKPATNRAERKQNHKNYVDLLATQFQTYFPTVSRELALQTYAAFCQAHPQQKSLIEEAFRLAEPSLKPLPPLPTPAATVGGVSKNAIAKPLTRSQLFDQPMPGAIPHMLRVVTEHSIMHHNDERIGYVDTRAFNLNDVAEMVLVARPIHPSERLNTNYRGGTYEEKPPTDLTNWLDSYYEVIAHLRAWRQVEPDLGKGLAHYIGNNFYDCMSGGMSKTAMAIVHLLLRQPGIDLTLQVYPIEDRWLTLADFLKETQPRLSQNIPPLLFEIAQTTSFD